MDSSAHWYIEGARFPTVMGCDLIPGEWTRLGIDGNMVASSGTPLLMDTGVGGCTCISTSR